MTRIEFSIINMIKILIAFLTANAVKIDAVEARRQARLTLDAKRIRLFELEEAEGADTSGVTRETDDLRLELCSSTVDVSGPLFSYAVATADPVLQALAKTTLPKLKAMRSENLILHTTEVCRQLQLHATALADYGITPAIIASYKTGLNAFDEADEAPREAINKKVAAGKQLTSELKITNAFIKNTLDPLMLPLKKTDPLLYDGYLQARIIVEPQTTHTQIRGLIATFDEKPLYGVDITLVNGQLRVAVQTDQNGAYTAKVSPEKGEWSLLAAKPGFQSATIGGILVQRGKTTKVDLKLKAE
ncbi:MAG: hypothetical protein JWP69_958 [Flaviaesturariibacter sp.]|nr:hypothetical protein [Flaviaesturariibacter sp.]